MEELLRKVDADFLAMIKEAEDDESKASENNTNLDAGAAEEKRERLGAAPQAAQAQADTRARPGGRPGLYPRAPS
jgi:hypothetical protein